MSKFIQTFFFFHLSTFLLPAKQKGEKIKSFLSSHFSILPQFFILLLFHLKDLEANETVGIGGLGQ